MDVLKQQQEIIQKKRKKVLTLNSMFDIFEMRCDKSNENDL